jgi:hypothetical protein
MGTGWDLTDHTHPLIVAIPHLLVLLLASIKDRRMAEGIEDEARGVEPSFNFGLRRWPWAVLSARSSFRSVLYSGNSGVN